MAIMAGTQLCCESAVAQTGERLIAAVTQCRTVADPAERVACYDRAAAALAQASGDGSLTVMGREEVAAKQRSLFGLAANATPTDRRAPAIPQVDTLDSTVSRRVLAGRDEFAITLADGSVWRTLEKARIDPEAGDPVHIRRGAMNGYLASFKGARAVRIERVR